MRMLKDFLSKLEFDFSLQVIALILLQTGIFLMDLFLPFSNITILAYIAIVQLTLWLPKSIHTLYASSANTLFIILGFFFENHDEPLFYLIFNRALAIIAVWVTALFVLRYERSVLKIGESESFKLLFKSAGEGLIIANKWGNIVNANQELANTFGYNEDELIDKNLKELIPKRYWEQYDEFKRNFYQNPQTIHINAAKGEETFYGLRKDGKEIPVEVGIGYYQSVGELLTVIFVVDISKRKEAEKIILQNKEWLSNFLDSSPAYISILDEKLNIIDCNKPMLNIFNVKTKEEIIGKHLTEVYSNIEERADLDKYEQVLKTGDRMVFKQEVEHPLFGHKYFNVRVFKAGTGVGSIIEDVTTETLAENKISESKERLSNFIDSTNSYITILDKNLNIIDCNKPILTMFNVKSKDEVIGKSLTVISPEIATSNYFNLYTQVLKTGESKEYEQEVELPLLGHKFFNVRLFKADSGIGSIIDDISEKKRNEEEIRRYAFIVSNSSDMLALISNSFHYISVNETYAKAFHLKKDQIINHTMAEIFGKSVFQKTIKPMAVKCLNGENIEFKAWIEFPSIGKRYMNFNYLPYYKTNGDAQGFTVNVRDLTEEKLVEDKLKESEFKLNQFLNSLPVGVYILDANSKPFYANKKSFEILNKEIVPEAKPEELSEIYKAYVAGTNNLYPANKNPIIQAMHGKRTSVDDIEIHRDGAHIPLSITGTPVYDTNGKIQYAIATFEDITEKKKTENALRIKEIEFKSIVELSHEAIYSCDINGNFTYVNAAVLKISGFSSKELIRHKFTKFIKPGHKKMVEDFYKSQFYSKQQSSTLQFPIITKSKEERWIEQTVDLIFEESKVNRIREFIAIAHDITDQKLSKEKLEKSSIQLNAIINNSQEAIISTDEKGNILYFNPAGEKLFGYSKKEVIGKPLKTILTREYVDKFEKEFEHYKKMGKPHLIGKGQYDLKGKRKSGKEFPLELTFTSWKENGTKKFLAIIRDVIEQEKLEKKLEKQHEH